MRQEVWGEDLSDGNQRGLQDAPVAAGPRSFHYPENVHRRFRQLPEWNSANRFEAGESSGCRLRQKTGFARRSCIVNELSSVWIVVMSFCRIHPRLAGIPVGLPGLLLP